MTDFDKLYTTGELNRIYAQICASHLALKRFVESEHQTIKQEIQAHTMGDSMLDGSDGPTKLLLACEFWRQKYFLSMKKIEDAVDAVKKRHADILKGRK